MRTFSRKYLIGFGLIVSMFTPVAAQENNYSFTWLDSSEKKMAGTINSKFYPQSEEGLYQLDFSVSWFDKDGKAMLEPGRMPVLWLSKWFLEVVPAQNVRCTAGDLNTPFNNLKFATSGKLNLQVMNGYEGKIEISASFQYALTEADYNSGRSYRIDLMGSNVLKMVFQVKSQKPVSHNDIGAGTKVQTVDPGKIAAAIQAATANYEKISSRVSDFNARRSVQEFNRPDYLQDLDVLVASIGNERALLNPDTLTADTVMAYRNRYDLLNESVQELRTAFLRYRISQSGPAAISDPSVILKKNDSLRNLIQVRMEPVVRGQLDSLSTIAVDQKLVAPEISGWITSGKGGGIDQKLVDSLIAVHEILKSAFLNLKINHTNTWNNYRADLTVLGPLPQRGQIEQMHNTFIENQNILQAAFDLVDRDIATISAARAAAPWYLSNRILWIGLLAIIVFVSVTAVWSSTRNKKLLKEGLSLIDGGKGNTQQVKSSATGVFPVDVPDEYFTIDYESSIPEAVVGKIHYHTSSIKSVYLMVQSALMESRGGDFGGYLFGNQYKLPGKGTSRSEVFVEKACDSKYLRSTISNDVNARADLMDELNELVGQNSKYRLVGWFSSITDNSMEIPEGLMKVHRSFFKEKWQIGILLNPGSEVLQGAGFLRRKSGYLDPMPDPAAFIKWNELYRFALNPASSAKRGTNGADKKDKDYSRIALNNTWGDSVVTAVNFDRAVAMEIVAVAANQAIPKDNFQVVGYLYGTSEARSTAEGKPAEYEVYVDRFIELGNEMTPRDLPGFTLIGWWGQANVDVINYLQSAIDYHEQLFREAYHISCLVNPSTEELRIFTRKHSLEMNNSTIETEEYSVKSLLSR